MSDSSQQEDKFVMQDRTAALERKYIEDYLSSKGHTRESVRRLPEEQAKRLMREASLYASTRLAEVEKRAGLLRDLHD